MAKKAAAVVPDAVLGPEDQDVQLVQTEGTAVSRILAGVGAFLFDAKALHAKAVAVRNEAVALRMPTNAEEDVHVQHLIKRATGCEKDLLAHFEDVTGALSRLHKSFTGKRALMVKAATDAKDTAQRLHNGYVENERRRVEAENRRLEQEALDKARAEREAELAKLAEAADAAEAASDGLSEREKRFCELYVGSYRDQPHRAAQVAGFKDPVKMSAQLLMRDKIRAGIRGLEEAAALRNIAQAKKDMEVAVEFTPVREDIQRAAGSHDRKTWSAEITDERLFVEAVIGGRHGIPADCLTINKVKLNEYATSLRTAMRWPGVKAAENTRTV